jgi:hypothetical protein
MSHYCSAHDPLLSAGFIVCARCQRRSYPADATWLDEDMLLVTWQPGCWHSRPHMQIVRPSQLEIDDTPEPERRPCKGTVRAGVRRGLPCSKPAAPGSDYCQWHGPLQQATP